VHERLTELVACSLSYADDIRDFAVVDEPSADVEAQDVPARTEAIVHDFLLSLPRIRRLLALDVQAAYDGDPAAQNADEIVCCYPGLETIVHYRVAHELHGLGVPLIPRMMTEWAHSRTGIDIHPAARIGPGFFIDHGTGVVIGQTCEIADHVTLYQGVTLGALSFEQDAEGNLVRGTKRHPTIERKVVIYANATILGGHTVVGANSVIGACVSVTRSVPPNTVVTIEKPSLRFREAS
jgi:serine O-acetyltransferase